MRAKLLAFIQDAFNEINALRDTDAQLDFSEQTPLYGKDSPLDSVDLVNLLLAIEERLEDELDVTFTIANEKAMSLKNSPFRSVASLCDYLEQELS